ncbi:MAG TPA: TIR domain-containing protein [Candidatus Didemnitutus sp.]|nr:TIR domain-containing protein [Candidatus Didemnitutus sp.]
MPESAPPSAHRAIFLSYAREDAPAVRRIAEALRAFGLEVWFDQNELRGGDAWDQKIRNQIKDCALFIPIISATTQTRTEGYFRREWRLAVDRTHDMAEGRTFLLPVVIDDLPENEAIVPEEFLKVHWTRISGAPSPEFVILVKQILDSPTKPSGRTRPPVASHSTPPAATTTKKPGFPAWAWGVMVIFAAAIGVVVFRPKHDSGPVPAPTTAAGETKPAEPAPASAPAHVEDKSVAVLPFENMSEEKDASAFFADGVHEDLLTNLSLIRDLHVVSRTSVMQYRGTTKSIRLIAQELGVAYILEGSVRRAGNKVRVTGQLIKAATDEHVWAEAYDRDLTDVFGIQAELSKAIAHALAAAISPAEKLLIERRPTDNLAAYDSYVKAHQITQSPTDESAADKQVSDLLLEAVRLDPHFAIAWGELARHDAYMFFTETDTSPARLERAKNGIETAVRLAPDDPAVIESRGDYYYYAFRDYARAAEQYQRLAVIRPNDAVVFGSLALIHRRQGRMNECMVEFRRALELDPHNLRYLRSAEQVAAALNLYPEAKAFQEHILTLVADDVTERAALFTLPFSVTGDIASVDRWFAETKAPAGQENTLIFQKKGWLLSKGDVAGFIRLDQSQRYTDAGVISRQQEDVFAAFAFAVAGDHAAARQRAEEVVTNALADLKSKPSAGMWETLAQAYAILGRPQEARDAAQKGVDLVPETSDAITGPNLAIYRGAVLAWIGDKDAAIAELARLLRTPFGENLYNARTHPFWFPLHGDPRFEQVVHDLKNNEPMI